VSTAIVAGAGLSGSLMAIYLARRGYRVDVYERRADVRAVPEAGGRSINLGLSARGMNALREVGLLDAVMKRCVPMRGRYIHTGGALPFQPYGAKASEVLHSILRYDLLTMLMDHAESFPNVRFHFGQPLTGIDPATGTAVFGTVEARADLVIGADGVFSTCRALLEEQGRTRTTLDSLDWGYKELTITAAADGRSRTELEGLHVWPGGRHGVMVAHPNVENSLTATMFLPLAEIERLDTAATVTAFLDSHYPDTAQLMPDRVAEWLEHPVGRLYTVRASTWQTGRVALIGDAAHAVYPFYGQGMNSSFEDCSVLDRCLDAADLPAALARYQQLRKKHTDVLARLSHRNFIELRDQLSSPWFRLRKQTDLALHRLLGPAWLPLYTMISHRDTPYATALRRSRLQDFALATVIVLLAAAAATPLLLG
jgi:kynurenine 3-monooxygenase